MPSRGRAANRGDSPLHKPAAGARNTGYGKEPEKLFARPRSNNA